MSSTPPDGRRGSGRFLPFLEARAFVRGLNFQVPKDFRAWCGSGQRPANVPSNPDVYYSEFVSWPDWLGTAIPRQPSTPFPNGNEQGNFARKHCADTQLPSFKHDTP